MRVAARALVVLSLGSSWAFCAASLAAGEVAAATEAAASESTAEEREVAEYPLAAEAPKPEPVTPATSEEILASIERGVDFLL
ncbi:MAG: hypothetical protein DCC67_06855, partial [Planctomycetota bacterium]